MEQTQEILMGRHLRQRIAFAHKVRNSTIREDFYSGRRPNSLITDEIQQTQKSTASVEAKSTLRRVKESSYVYPPLKSIAKHLYFILDNCEVQPPSNAFNP